LFISFVTVYKKEFLFRIKDKCCPFNYQYLSLGQEHQVYNIEDSFNIEDRWRLHSWDFLRLPQKKPPTTQKQNKINTKTPIILKGFENSQQYASLDIGKTNFLVCKANDKTFQECTETP